MEFFETGGEMALRQRAGMKVYGTVRAGSGTVYSQLRTYLTTKSMAVETNFAFVEANYLDIDNFIDYHLAVLYFQNFDIGRGDS